MHSSEKQQYMRIFLFLRGISGEFLLVSVFECELPRGSVHPITLALAGHRSTAQPAAAARHTHPRLCIPQLFFKPTLTLVFFISEPLLTTFTIHSHGTARL